MLPKHILDQLLVCALLSTIASSQAQPDIPNVQTQSKESSGTEGGKEPKSGKVFFDALRFFRPSFFRLILTRTDQMLNLSF